MVRTRHCRTLVLKVFLPKVILILALVGGLFVFADRPAHAQTLKADHLFGNTRASYAGTAPAVSDIGPTTNTFASDTVNGASRPVLRFPDGNGVQATTKGVIPANSYTIVALFKVATPSSKTRLLDFKNGTTDDGLYVDSNRLNFYPVGASGTTSIPSNTYAQLVLTRNTSGTVVAYVNGVQQFSFQDTSNRAVIDANNKLRFFRDNEPGTGVSGEDSAGSVARIRLYSGVLGPTKVAALDRVPAIDPPLITSPNNNSFDTDGNITLSGTAKPNSSVEVFEGTTSGGTTTANASGAWTKSLSAVPDGNHTYTAKATSGSTVSVSGNTRTITVDTVKPTVSSVSPLDGATNVAATENVLATFSEKMKVAPINSTTFKLVRNNSDGTKTAVAGTVSYNATTQQAKLDPSADLTAGANYTATVTTGAQDLAGNPLAASKSWSFTVAPPPQGTTVVFAPSPLNFTSDASCFPEGQYLTITNNSPGNVTFANVSITGPDAAHFSTGSQRYLANNGPFTVGAGNFFQDEVTFVPTNGAPQPRTYSATLTYKDATGATIGSSVTLSGRTSCLIFG